MRIVLVTTPVRLHKPNLLAPLGIMSLAAHLEQQGHTVRIVDAALLREPHDRIARRVADLDPQLIGIGGIITAYAYIIGLGRELKDLVPAVPIVLGGQVLVNNASNCFRHMHVDYAIHGYGEIALEKLVAHLEGRLPVDRIPGLSFRDSGHLVTNPGREFFRHMDDKPLPAYHLVDMEHYVAAATSAIPVRRTLPPEHSVNVSRGMLVMGTLGCSDRCTFCIHEQEFVGLKRHTNEYVIAHLRHLRDVYGVGLFLLGEEMFIAGLEQARQFNALMQERLPDCYWAATTRAESVTPELIEELKDGHCVGLHWGYEAGSQRILELMQKRMTVSTNERAYAAAAASGQLGSLSFLVGNVGESPLTIKETIASIRRAGITEGTVFYVSPYPGGRIWDWALERGIIRDPHRYLLDVSDVDPENHINVNLTPYPDFILRAWKRMISRALYEEALRRQGEAPFGARASLKLRLRAFLGRKVLPALVDAYFAYYALTRTLFRTPKDRRHEYRSDSTGALLPARLIVGKPQRHLSSEEIEALWSLPQERVPL